MRTDELHKQIDLITPDRGTERLAIAIGNSSDLAHSKKTLSAAKVVFSTCDLAVDQIREIVMLEELNEDEEG